MEPSGSQLDSNLPKSSQINNKNVFVTQLHQREDEDDHAPTLPAFGIVQESAGRLLETGNNTLQRTLLLKKEVEVEKVDGELAAKREEFRQRMEACTQRQVEIQKQQQRMKDRVSKFEKFIKDNEAKRRRAIQKYQSEVKLKEQKALEWASVEAQLEQLRDRHSHLKDKLAAYRKYEEYLLRVIDILPAHYLEVQDSMLTSLMMRHHTLSSTNLTLVENLSNMTDQLECLRLELEETRREHDKHKLSINSLLSQQQKQQEATIDRNKQREVWFSLGKAELRAKRTELGQIMMAVDNLTEKCRRNHDSMLKEMNLNQKLMLMKEYIVERAEVARMAAPDKANSATSERSIARGRGNKSISTHS